MTFRRKIFSLSIALGCFLAAFIALTLFQQGSSKKASFPLVRPERGILTTHLELVSKGESVSFEKKDGRWFVSYAGFLFPARDKRIAELLSLLSHESSRVERSRQVASLRELGLTDDTADRISLYSQDHALLSSLLIGNVTPGGLFFMRFADKTVSFSGEEDFTGFLSSERRTWYELDLFPQDQSFSAEDVQRITVRRGGNGYTLVRAPDHLWRIEQEKGEPFLLDSDRVDSYAKSLSGIQAEDFNSVREPFAALAPDSVTMELGNGKQISIAVLGMTPDGRALIARTGSIYRYLLQKDAEILLLPGERYFSAAPGQH